MASLNINVDEIPDDDFLCPAGSGTAQVIKSELEELPDNKGTILQVTSEFMDGPLARRMAREGFLIRDGNGSNGQWKEISAKSLKKLCTAVGHTGMLTNSEQLHFKPYNLTVGVRTDKNGKDRNTFTAKPLGAPGATATAAAPAAGNMPWQK